MLLDNTAAALTSQVAKAVDSAFVRLAFRTKRQGKRGTSDATYERLVEAAAFYPEAERRGLLYPAPAVPELQFEVVRAIPTQNAVVHDVSWRSGFCSLQDGYRQLLGRCPANHFAHARWYQHAEPRPAVIFVHGWGGGVYAFEERAFHARRLFQLGADVLHFVLPFHARRGLPHTGVLRQPLFPSTDPICTNEAAAQAVYDLRALIAALRERGAPAIGVTGVSLGGYTTALLATVDPDVDAIVPVLAFGSIPALIWAHAEGTPARRWAEERGVTGELFARAFAPTSPIHRRPVVRREALKFVSGTHDQVVPLSHTQALCDHFGACLGGPVELKTYAGGHIVQAGRRQLFESVARFLAERGVLPGARVELDGLQGSLRTDACAN